MQKLSICFITWIIFSVLSCSPGLIEKTYIEKVVTNQGAVIELNGARFEIPANGVADSTLVRIGKHVSRKRVQMQGYTFVGESYVIEPETLVFQKPIKVACAVKSGNTGLASRIATGFVPLANDKNEDGTLTARLWHGGEYLLVENPGQYGMIEHKRTKEGMIVVADVYVGDYVENFKKALRQNGYDLPVWTFHYDRRKSIEANAVLLAEELRNLHGQYGEFRMDIVSFGIGGLVAHRYFTDTSYYQRDISSAVIAIGTPFSGSNFADLENALKGKSPFRFFFLDGMGENAAALVPGSEFIARVQEKKHLPGYHYYDDPTENKNFASIRGRSTFAGLFAEEHDGDGLVSLNSTALTWIEPEPFELHHFDLFENAAVQKVVIDLVKLYRSFTWPALFTKAWQVDTTYTSIVDIWEREARLNYRGVNFDILLEHNMNMLRSAPEGAILVTNGDNDTYPAWLLQEGGFRKDVLILNRSLFNLKEYVLFLQKKGLGLPLADVEIDAIVPEKKEGTVITRSDKLIKQLIERGKRQVVFSTTVYAPERFGYPLCLSGLVYEIGEHGTTVDGKNVDIEKTVKFFHETFTYEKIFSVPFSAINKDIQALFANYAGALAFTVAALKKQENYERAMEEIEFAKKMLPDFAVPYFAHAEAMVRMETNDFVKADSLVQILVESPEVSATLKVGLAEAYHRKSMNGKAIKVLARVLQDDPENREVLDLINRYQEE